MVSVQHGLIVGLQLVVIGLLLWFQYGGRPAPVVPHDADLLALARQAWIDAGLNADAFTLDADVMHTGKYSDFLHLLTQQTGHPIRTVRDVIALLGRA